MKQTTSLWREFCGWSQNNALFMNIKARDSFLLWQSYWQQPLQLSFHQVPAKPHNNTGSKKKPSAKHHVELSILQFKNRNYKSIRTRKPTLTVDKKQRTMCSYRCSENFNPSRLFHAMTSYTTYERERESGIVKNINGTDKNQRPAISQAVFLSYLEIR